MGPAIPSAKAFAQAMVLMQPCIWNATWAMGASRSFREIATVLPHTPV